MADDDVARYRSRWRAPVRFALQRILFRGLVRATVAQTIRVDPGVCRVRGAFVLVANHTSHLDAPMLAQGLPPAQARYLATGVAADYFFTVWHRRWFVRWLFNAFPIDRDGSREHVGTTTRVLRSGVPILLFPEGTRQKSGRLGRFHPGAAACSRDLGVPVVPAAIVGGYEAMPKGRSWPRRGRPPVRVVLGEPMRAQEGEPVGHYSERIRCRVQDLYDEHYEEILGSPDPRRKDVP